MEILDTIGYIFTQAFYVIGTISICSHVMSFIEKSHKEEEEHRQKLYALAMGRDYEGT